MPCTSRASRASRSIRRRGLSSAACTIQHAACDMQRGSGKWSSARHHNGLQHARYNMQHGTWRAARHVVCNVARCCVRHATRHVTFNLVVPRVARVYVSLDDVGELPKDAVSCDFSSNSFDLKVVGLKVHTPCNVQHVTSGRRCSMPHASCRVVQRATCNVCRARATDWRSCNGRFSGVAVNATAG